MRVLSLTTLQAFWKTHPPAEKPLGYWYAVTADAVWKTPADVRKDFNTADFIVDSRVIFDIGANKYRLIAHVSYKFANVKVKFVGTHADYDAIKGVEGIGR
ncbi:type II toxin-antitoxin system HigB family toxin [Acidisoma silvae]|uniref:Type II toxin-antitoxin system HigB family toxin n=1 Tax=Acidisoma silvae TaxID=2802396 RepID=A0A963YX66_9PROT|nr:type II toxin-antitoxin system HigB family toxin [Acidisoma silvae]MCB8878484.1 type II toxin-antitoxin system HigB family toxin [Acidisoma silvae]